MLINADFSRRAAVAAEQYQWVQSPQRGVERVMLDRIGEEKARATSIVRYAPQSYFPAHAHPAGEEIFVLSGAFSEEEGRYPAGWYLRNPPGSSHQPFSEEGAVIFVKLRQMSPEEQQRVRINTNDAAAWRTEGSREVCPLFADAREQVSLQRLPAGECILSGHVEGAELLVVQGAVVDAGQRYVQGSWIRLPAGEYPQVISGPEGATVFMKLGRFAALGLGV